MKLAIEGGEPIRKELLRLVTLKFDESEYIEIKKTLDSGMISRGSKPIEFGNQLSNYIGCKNSIVLNSGTAALHLSLKSLGFKEGEVLVPALSFVATAFTPLYCNLKPVFVEVEEDFNLSVNDLKKKITNKTKAIIPVDYAGQPCDLDEIREIAKEDNLAVIEDAAQAIGSSYKNKKIGNVSDLTCFSFFATKNIAAGEGGAVCTNNDKLAEKIQLMKAHGIKKTPNEPKASGYYDVVDLGYNYHLSNINIALLSKQLEKVDTFNEKRIKNAQYLTKLLSEIPSIKLPIPKPDRKHVYHLYTILLDLEKLNVSREQIVQALIAEGIEVGVYYKPIHLFSYFVKRYGYKEGHLPITEKISKSLLTLPMHPLLKKEDLSDIYHAIKKVLTKYGG